MFLPRFPITKGVGGKRLNKEWKLCRKLSIFSLTPHASTFLSPLLRSVSELSGYFYHSKLTLAPFYTPVPGTRPPLPLSHIPPPLSASPSPISLSPYPLLPPSLPPFSCPSLFPHLALPPFSLFPPLCLPIPPASIIPLSVKARSHLPCVHISCSLCLCFLGGVFVRLP